MDDDMKLLQRLADCGGMEMEFLELKQEAYRYRFLRRDFSPFGLNIDGNHAWAYRRNAMLKGPTLDAAIDAAMAPRPGKDTP